MPQPISNTFFQHFQLYNMTNCGQLVSPFLCLKIGFCWHTAEYHLPGSCKVQQKTYPGTPMELQTRIHLAYTGLSHLHPQGLGTHPYSCTGSLILEPCFYRLQVKSLKLVLYHMAVVLNICNIIGINTLGNVFIFQQFVLNWWTVPKKNI